MAHRMPPWPTGEQRPYEPDESTGPPPFAPAGHAAQPAFDPAWPDLAPPLLQPPQRYEQFAFQSADQQQRQPQVPTRMQYSAPDSSSYASVSSSCQPNFGRYAVPTMASTSASPPSLQHPSQHVPPQHQHQHQHQSQHQHQQQQHAQFHQAPAFSMDQMVSQAALQSHQLELQIAREYGRALEADHQISRMHDLERGLSGGTSNGSDGQRLAGEGVGSGLVGDLSAGPTSTQAGTGVNDLHAMHLRAGEMPWQCAGPPTLTPSSFGALDGGGGGVGLPSAEWTFPPLPDMGDLFATMRTMSTASSSQSPEQAPWLMGGAAQGSWVPSGLPALAPPPHVHHFGLPGPALPPQATQTGGHLTEPPSAADRSRQNDQIHPRGDHRRPGSATAASTSDPAPAGPPPAKPRGSAPRAKRYLLPGTHIASCADCHTPIAHLQLRGEDPAFAVEWEGVWSCKPCLERKGVDSLAQAETTVKKKRNREMQDTNGLVVCDVCFITRGSGGIFPVDGKSSIDFAVEFICVNCNDKYKRCTDCGGGGGGRIGIGKWRCKELFLPGRKTCKLSHARMGAATMDLGVWKLDHVGNSPARDEFIRLCEELWKEKSYTRLAIPEILESKDGSSRSFADIEADLDQGWPIKEKLFSSTGSRSTDIVQPYLGLTWCRIRSRKQTDEDDNGSHEETFLTAQDAPRMRKINSLGIIPQNYELGGILFGYWKKLTGTLLLTTFLPFEATNGDDRTFLTVGEFAAQIVPELDAINRQRIMAHRQGLLKEPPFLLPYLEHMWCILDNTDPIISERMQDMLSRRRQFHTLDDYLKLHPNVDRAIFKPDLSYVPKDRDNWINKQTTNSIHVMVRWLGPRLDSKRLEEIFTAEFAKGTKPRKK